MKSNRTQQKKDSILDKVKVLLIFVFIFIIFILIFEFFVMVPSRDILKGDIADITSKTDTLRSKLEATKKKHGQNIHQINIILRHIESLELDIKHIERKLAAFRLIYTNLDNDRSALLNKIGMLNTYIIAGDAELDNDNHESDNLRKEIVVLQNRIKNKPNRPKEYRGSDSIAILNHSIKLTMYDQSSISTLRVSEAVRIKIDFYLGGRYCINKNYNVTITLIHNPGKGYDRQKPVANEEFILYHNNINVANTYYSKSFPLDGVTVRKEDYLKIDIKDNYGSIRASERKDFPIVVHYLRS